VITNDKNREITVKTAPTTKGNMNINRGYGVEIGHFIKEKGKKEMGKWGVGKWE
jgi:hypothetical protein